MAYTHLIQLGYALPGRSIQRSVAVTADSEHSVSAVIPASEIDFLVELALTKDQLKSLVFYATKALTLKVKDGGELVQTINLAAEVPLIWAGAKDYNANPLLGDCTHLLVTNGETSDVTLEFSAAIDATPES